MMLLTVLMLRKTSSMGLGSALSTAITSPKRCAAMSRMYALSSRVRTLPRDSWPPRRGRCIRISQNRK